MTPLTTNSEGHSTPDTPGFVFFFWDTANPTARVKMVFSEESDAPTGFFGEGQSLLSVWHVSALRAAELSLVSYLGQNSDTLRDGFEIDLLDQTLMATVNGDTDIAEMLLTGAIQSLEDVMQMAAVDVCPISVFQSQHEKPSGQVLEIDGGLENQPSTLWQGAGIESVVESPAERELVYSLRNPEIQSGRGVAATVITFSGCRSHQVEETTAFEGIPTIISISELKKEGDYTSYKLETSAGNRLVKATDVHIFRFGSM